MGSVEDGQRSKRQVKLHDVRDSRKRILAASTQERGGRHGSCEGRRQEKARISAIVGCRCGSVVPLLLQLLTYFCPGHCFFLNQLRGCIVTLILYVGGRP